MEENGVWRTVGGRRIFIKEGEDLSTAMKKSGKFKSSKKENKKSEEPKTFYEGKKDIEEEFEQIYAEEGLEYGLRNSNVEYLSKKYDIPKTQVKAYMKDVAEKFDKKNLEKNKISEKFKNAPADIQKNVSDFEKAGVKVDDAFETNRYGTGKEDRFELEDGRYIAHTKESFGEKNDSWSVEKLVDGETNTYEFKSYDDMLKNINSSKVNQVLNKRSEWSYQKSYMAYQKTHPESKMTFSQFKKMEEE